MSVSRLLGKCVICASSFRVNNASSLPCGHTFHFRCILPWVQRSKNCPNCRAATTEDQIVKQLFFDTSDLDSGGSSGSGNEQRKGLEAGDRESSPQSTGSDTSWHLNGEEAENDDALNVTQMLELAMGSDYLNSDGEESVSSSGLHSNFSIPSESVGSREEWQSFRTDSIDSGSEEMGSEYLASIFSDDSSDHSLMSNDTSASSIATASSQISTPSIASYFGNESPIHSEDFEDRGMSPVFSDLSHSGEESSSSDGGCAWVRNFMIASSTPNARSEEDGDSLRDLSSPDSSPRSDHFSMMQTGATEESSSSSEGSSTGSRVIPRRRNPRTGIRGRNPSAGVTLPLTKGRKRQVRTESDSDSSIEDCCRKRRTVE